nr:Phage-related tail fibre protein [uncultured Mediterranean phage uvMED]
MTVSNYSTTAANNTTINSISIAEGMPPSNVNNAMRNQLSDIRSFLNDKEWFVVGDRDGACTFTRASGTSVTVASTNVTADYHANRRIKIVGSNTGTLYGKIASSSFSTNTTINFTFDSGTISGSDSTVSVFVGSPFTNPAIPVIDDNSLGTSTVLPPSQSSVKNFVENLVTGQDLDYAGDSGTGAVDLDSQTFTLAGGEGIDTTASGQTLTIAGEDATTSNKGIASFSSDNFSVSSGAVTIKNGGVENAELVNSTVNYGGVSLALGGSDTTPAFNLSDATNYPTSSLTGTISNSQLATGIDATKIADGSVTNSEFQFINTLSSNAQTQLDGKLTASDNLSDVANAGTSRTNLGLGTISTQASSNVAITGGSITGLGSPSNNSDVAIKSYVDNLVTGLKTRIIVRAASTGNISLSSDLQNGDTLDGVTLATNDKVLIKSQSDNTQNGIYKVVASGTASRDPDFDTVDELAGQMIIVKEGSVNADSFHLCTTDSGTIGSAAITFTQVTPSSGGTVTQVGIAQAGSEFTISGSPVTTSGNITLGIGTIANTKISGLGTASTKAVGTSADNVVQLDGSARLPAVDGSQLTNLPSTGASTGFAIAMAVAL